MADFSSLVQKAFYLGIGLASYANEKARMALTELEEQAQKVADKMVARGEITAEEARKYVDDLVQQARKKTENSSQSSSDKEPRLIEIITEEEETTKTSKSNNVNELRDQVDFLQEELRRLKRK
ncbi:MAG: phasin family protein [cyanobacterium endosymbiont of Rhopalodia sterrenbergii]